MITETEWIKNYSKLQKPVYIKEKCESIKKKKKKKCSF